MIKYIYKSLRTREVEQIPAYRRGTWVHVEAPTDEEIALLAQDFSVDTSILEDARDEDEMPRLEKEQGISYVFVRFAFRTRKQELDTAPVLFVFGKDLLMTVSAVHVPAIDSLLRGKLEFATTQPAKLVLQILQLMSDQYDGFINQTSRQIKQIRARLRGHEIRTQDFIDFVTIEDELNEFLSALQPTNSTLRRLLVGRHIPLFEEDQDIVEDLLLNNEQSIEGCRSNLKSINNIRESYSAISSHNLNQTIKILTIATVAIALPNVFYGMYGMNVPLPFQHEPGAFWFIFGFTFFVVIVAAVLARKKKIF